MPAPPPSTLEARLHEALARREAAPFAAGSADAIHGAARALAERFSAGATLFSFGTADSAADAEHVCVEFLHPVIVGKRALPACALTLESAASSGALRSVGAAEVFADLLHRQAAPGDAALGLSSDGRCEATLRGLEAAQRLGLATFALAGGGGGDFAKEEVADHVIVATGADALAAREQHVCFYHLLWEQVHVELESADAVAGDGAPEPAASLYPFLDGARRGEAGDGAVSIEAKLAEAIALRRRSLEANAATLAACARRVADALGAGGRIFFFGNGGSATDACALAHLFARPPRGPAARARSLVADAATVTALANDVGFGCVFARSLAAVARPGDVAVGLSTSGDSENLIEAFAEARRRGLATVGFAGYDGGRMARDGNVDFALVVPSTSVHRIQEAQTVLGHLWWELCATHDGRTGPCAS